MDWWCGWRCMEWGGAVVRLREVTWWRGGWRGGRKGASRKMFIGGARVRNLLTGHCSHRGGIEVWWYGLLGCSVVGI